MSMWSRFEMGRRDSRFLRSWGGGGWLTRRAEISIEIDIPRGDWRTSWEIVVGKESVVVTVRV